MGKVKILIEVEYDEKLLLVVVKEIQRDLMRMGDNFKKSLGVRDYRAKMEVEK